MGHAYAVAHTPFAALKHEGFIEAPNPVATFGKEPPTQYLSATQASQSLRSWSYVNAPVLLVTVMLACIMSAAYFGVASVDAEVAVSGYARQQQPFYARAGPERSHEASTLKCQILHSSDPSTHSSTDAALCSDDLEVLDVEGPPQYQQQHITIWRSQLISSSSSGDGSSSSSRYRLVRDRLGRRHSQHRRQLRLLAAS